jgi:hypothetical protein
VRDHGVTPGQQSTTLARWLLTRLRQQLRQQSTIEANSHSGKVYTQPEPKSSPERTQRKT